MRRVRERPTLGVRLTLRHLRAACRPAGPGVPPAPLRQWLAGLRSDTELEAAGIPVSLALEALDEVQAIYYPAAAAARGRR